MRGKKIDTEFLSAFIQECVTSGADSPEAIADRAKLAILKIDKEIMEVEKKKIKRSKLLDVISSFEKPDNSAKKEDAKTLIFYKISSPHICKKICDSLKEGFLPEISVSDINSLDTAFCIKQMIEYKILSKIGKHLIKGDMFDSYLKFILRENNV